MKARYKKANRKAVNLTLSKDARQKAVELCDTLKRPSISNLVEWLVERAHQEEQRAA